MIYQAVVALAIVAAAASIGTNLYTSDVSAQKALFEDFKIKFKRNYKSVEEENLKFQVFVGNLKLVDERNEAELNNGGEACHGISKFADITQEEFESKYLSDRAAKRNVKNLMTDEDFPDLPDEKMLGATKDWTQQGLIIKQVQNQFSCNAGYSFAVESQIYSDVQLKSITPLMPSAEQGIECSSNTDGCNGGSTDDVYDYILGAGLCTEPTYPYTSFDGAVGPCKYSTCTVGPRITKYTTITNVELTIAKYIISKGPVSGCVNSNTWSTYTSGSITLCGKVPNNCVQIVGVNNVSTSDGFWKLRNNWGADWGMDGYIKLRYGANVCNITHNPTWTTTVPMSPESNFSV